MSKVITLIREVTVTVAERRGGGEPLPAVGLVPADDLDDMTSCSTSSYCWSTCSFCRNTFYFADPDLQQVTWGKMLDEDRKAAFVGNAHGNLLKWTTQLGCCKPPTLEVEDFHNNTSPGRIEAPCGCCCGREMRFYGPGSRSVKQNPPRHVVDYGVDGGLCTILQIFSCYVGLCWTPNSAQYCVNCCERCGADSIDAAPGFIVTRYPVQPPKSNRPKPRTMGEQQSLLNAGDVAGENIPRPLELVWRRHANCPCCFPWYFGYENFPSSLPNDDRKLLVAGLPWMASQKFGVAAFR